MFSSVYPAMSGMQRETKKNTIKKKPSCPVVVQGSATVNATVVGSIPTRGNEIFNIFISSLWQRSKVALNSATQYAMTSKDSAESEEGKCVNGNGVL